MKNRNIVFITNKEKDELNCSVFTELFHLNQLDFTISNSLDDLAGPYETIIIDQFIDGILSTEQILPYIENTKAKYIYILISRMLDEKEEDIINDNKISILSMPINQAEIFNRIINVS